MGARRFFRLLMKVHRWGSYGLLVPLSFWILGGSFMTLAPIELVRSAHVANPLPHIKAQEGELARLQEKGFLDNAYRFETKAMPEGRRALLIDKLGGEQMLVDLENGAILSPLDEAAARTLALMNYRGEARIKAAQQLTEAAPSDYRGRGLPVWQIEMSDGLRFYIDPMTSAVTARRSDLWRVYDFFWMLHTLDFDGRDNFNNGLVRTMALLSVIFLLTGIGLVIYRLIWAGRRKSS